MQRSRQMMGFIMGSTLLGYNRDKYILKVGGILYELCWMDR